VKVKSCFSIKIDPYKAGLEIGEILSEISPEIIFIFPTIHYKGSDELIETIYDVLNFKPLAAFPSFGKFGPIKKNNGYSKTLFYNMMFILVLMGI